VNPQDISAESFIELKGEDIINKIMEFSVPSARYGENLVHHNFDFCEAYFLSTLKRKYELEDNIEKYHSVRFVGESFCEVAEGTNVNAIGEVREVAYEPIE
jgi:hypothetical protein